MGGSKPNGNSGCINLEYQEILTLLLALNMGLMPDCIVGDDVLMKLVFRPALPKDFNGFYQACFPQQQYNDIFRAEVERQWMVLLDNSTTLSMIVEDQEREEGERIVGCAQGVFITESFAHLARSGTLPPWINAHVTNPLSDGSSPLLCPDEVRTANSGDGLIGLLTRWTVAWEDLSSDDALYLRSYFHRSFKFFSSGYKLKEFFVEATGTLAKEEALRAGLCIVND